MSADGCVSMAVERVRVDSAVEVLVGDCREGLATLPASSVQCIVTSPPYLGLRDYGLDGADWPAVSYRPRYDLPPVEVPAMRCVLGAEPSLLAFVAHQVLVARALRRVLRDDGTLWLNLGASYAAGTTAKRPPSGKHAYLGDALPLLGAHRRKPSSWTNRCDEVRWTPEGLPAKNLIPSPWAVAEALQADGWVLRAEVIWRKPNPMPEAVTDRPTVSHEQVFLLSKRGKYFYDRAAIAEPLEHPEASTPEDFARAMSRRRATATEQRQGPLDAERYRQSDRTRRSGNKAAKTGDERGRPGDHRKGSIPWEAPPSGTRNARSVWTIPTQPFKGAHFATFPEEIARRCILAGSRPGDVVLDPFGGSGTVGAVAKTTGRTALLCEAQRAYLPLIAQRVASAPSFQPMLGGAR